MNFGWQEVGHCWVYSQLETKPSTQGDHRRLLPSCLPLKFGRYLFYLYFMVLGSIPGYRSTLSMCRPDYNLGSFSIHICQLFESYRHV